MFGSKGYLGLDIGSSYIKAVQLKEGKSGYELEHFDLLPISPELIVESSIIDAIRLTDALKELIRKGKNPAQLLTADQGEDLVEGRCRRSRRRMERQ